MNNLFLKLITDIVHLNLFGLYIPISKKIYTHDQALFITRMGDVYIVNNQHNKDTVTLRKELEDGVDQTVNHKIADLCLLMCQIPELDEYIRVRYKNLIWCITDIPLVEQGK